MRRAPERLVEKPFDLLIIGGGIYGATLAWMASSAGLTTALIEKGDFGEATSANTQKIIHGGMRYLQRLDLSRVMESVRERKRMLQLAPHLIDPLRCIMPIFGYGIKGKEVLTAGLSFYNLISHSRNDGMPASKAIPPCRVLSKADTLQLLPDLQTQGLRGSAEWHDAICMNTERMVLGFIRSAYNSGAGIANYVLAEKMERKNTHYVSVTCRDLIRNTNFDVVAQKVANCCGPWIRDLIKPAEAEKQLHDLHFVAGVNVITRAIFSHRVAVGLRDPADPASRLYFVVPWRGHSLLGTEWFAYKGNPGEFKIKEEHCAELLKGFNKAYPPANLGLHDVQHALGGLVPGSLTRSSTGPQLKPWNHFRLLDHSEFGQRRVVSVIGVKYTTAAGVARRVLGFLFPERYIENYVTATGFSTADDKPERLPNLQTRWDSVFGESQVRRIASTYGPFAEDVLKSASQCVSISAGKDNGIDLVRGEVAYVIENEMALTLDDIVRRRTDRGTDGLPPEDELVRVADYAASFLGWTQIYKLKEIEDLKKHYLQFN